MTGTMLAVFGLSGRVMKALFLSLAVILPANLAWADPIQGTIVKMDKQKSRLRIKTPEGERVFVISKETLGLEHAIEGAEVRIEYTREGEDLRASEINPSKPDNKG